MAYLCRVIVAGFCASDPKLAVAPIFSAPAGMVRFGIAFAAVVTGADGFWTAGPDADDGWVSAACVPKHPASASSVMIAMRERAAIGVRNFFMAPYITRTIKNCFSLISGTRAPACRRPGAP